MILHQYGDVTCSCGPRSTEKLDSVARCFSRNADYVTLDNPQTLLWTVFVGNEMNRHKRLTDKLCPTLRHNMNIFIV